MSRFLRIAHRGAGGLYPENTQLSFEQALQARANMIELDCQLSRDGHVVVFHDERLLRTAGVRGLVRERSLAELKTLDVGRWRGQKYAGQRILTLEEALDVIAGRALLCLDIKQFPQSTPGIELKLLFILSHYDFLDQAIFSSFDYRCLARVRELAPEARLGLIFAKGVNPDPFEVAAQLAAASIHVDHDAASPEFLARAWEQGLDVYVWTVNRTAEIARFASLGVQGIVSDFPDRLWRVR